MSAYTSADYERLVAKLNDDLAASAARAIAREQEHAVNLRTIHVENERLVSDLAAAQGITRRLRESILAGCLEVTQARAAELADSSDPWLLWCGLNDEANMLAEAIPGAVNVHGALTPDEKADLLLGFAHGEFRTLITKPKIASLGLNFQRCAHMAFVGMSDSYEQYYQAIRRSCGR